MRGGVWAPRNLLPRAAGNRFRPAGDGQGRGLTFTPAETGNYALGTLVGSVNLPSGKFAMIDDGLGLSLVPRQPVLETAAGALYLPGSPSPALALPDTHDRTADVYTLSLAMNATLERWIRGQPECWLWLHRRWPEDPS